jgi:YHS domain-containing protein
MKSNYILASCFVAVIGLAACNNNGSVATEKKDSAATMAPGKTDSVKYTAAMVDNAKDPSCGMPVGAGVEDTVHYNNKTLGFCSKECKDDFIKDAAKNFAAVEWKK